ncbi:MAG: FG-GAP repeat domain-containing protein [Candidatus Sumerlaeaceae bacterium]
MPLSLTYLVFWLLTAVGYSRPVQFRQVSVPVQSLNPKMAVHPVDLWGDEKLEFVVVSPSGSLDVFGWDGDKLKSEQRINFPTEDNGPTYYSFARLIRGGKYSLILLRANGLYVWPVTEEHFDTSPKKLLDISLPKTNTAGETCEYFEMAYDLDGDGIDELILPQAERFTLYHAREPLHYVSVSLPRDPFKSTSTFQFRRQLPDDPVRVPSISGSVLRRRGVDDLVFFDANGDAKEDLVFTSIVHAPKSREIERYEIFFQKSGLTFGVVPDQVIEIPYDERSYVTFRDFDRDGRCEAFTVASNYDIVAPRTIIRILGGDAKRTTSSKERFRLVTKDPIGLVKLGDFNRDGVEDFACTFFSYQFGSTEDIASIVAANRVRFRLQFFLGQTGKLFARQPSYEFELNLSLKPESYGSYPPFYLVPDMNGDGIVDLVARADETRVAVYFSEAKFAYPRQPTVSLLVPPDAALSFADCNGDGLDDLIVTSIQKQSVSIYLAPPRREK